MITIERLPDGLKVIPALTPPCVYVDYAGIADLAQDADLGTRFREALLGLGGTLYLSWAHLLELFGLGLGPLYYRIQSYLGTFHANFILSDCDSNAVIKRERAFKWGMQNPCIDVDFVKVLVANWDFQGILSPAIILRVIENGNGLARDCQAMHRRHRDDLHEMIRQARERYRSDPQLRRTLDDQEFEYRAGAPPTDYLRRELQRATIRSQDKLKPSEGIDLEHSVVALAYCDHVVLDKQWAARVHGVRKPVPMARVWKVGQLVDLTSHLTQ